MPLLAFRVEVIGKREGEHSEWTVRPEGEIDGIGAEIQCDGQTIAIVGDVQ